jgi:hypothetical protein
MEDVEDIKDDIQTKSNIIKEAYGEVIEQNLK